MSKVVKVIGAAAAGFVAGVLLAPKSGRETRADIKRKTDEARDYTVDKAQVVKEKANAGFEAVKEGTVEASKEARGFFDRAGKQASEVAKDAKKTANSVADEAKESSREARKAVK